MSVLKQLKKANLKSKLDEVYDKFVTSKDDKDSRRQLDESIDASGLKSPKTMNLVGTLQRLGKLQPGLYKELVALNKELSGSDGASSHKETAEVSSSASTPSGGSEVMSTEEKAQAEGKAEEKSNVVDLGNFQLTEKEQAKIKALLQKKEEKVRQTLLKYEQKQGERLKARAEKRAQRQGMKIEQMQDIKERKEKITVLREEIKTRKTQMKTLKDEIKALKPQRKKKEGEADAPVESKEDKAARKAAEKAKKSA